MTERAERETFRAVFAIREYRYIWAGQITSLIGDQLAVVAVTWLVYEVSGSPLLSAAAYSISFLPWLIGGPLLSGLADRYPRRDLMVFCDLARAALMSFMALPGLPLWLLCGLLFVNQLLASPFNAARAATLPDVLPGDLYVLGTAVGTVTTQFGQVIGFAVGGLMATVLVPTVSLGLNSVTFVLSAALLGWGVRKRPPVRQRIRRRVGALADARQGVLLIARDVRLRLLTGFGLLSALYIVPEGLAAPYAGELAQGPAAAGALLACGPFGVVLGSLALTRWVNAGARLTLMGPLAIIASVPLLGFAVTPGLIGAMAIIAACGAASSYQLAANAAFVAAVPVEYRGQAFGLVQAAMTLAQGGCILGAGGLAQTWPAAWVMALTGAVGLLASGYLAVAWKRASSLAHPAA
jgi:hypothetical protein